MDENQINQPTVIVPNRLFLVGAIHGFNAGRLLERQQITSTNPEIKSEIQPFTTAPTYVGHWFHVECARCQYVFAFDHLNELPENDLICPTCNNVIIQYNSINSAEWHIGQIKL